MPRESEPPDEEASYAGRWVARVGGKIVGQGSTPEGARRAAQADRYKEKPEITYMPSELPGLPFHLLDRVTAAASAPTIHLVGGAVRDALLGASSHDFDLVVPSDAIGTARRAARALAADFFVLDEAFDAARVILSSPDGSRDVLDFSSYRGGDLQSDLQGRDFSINAIAIDLKTRATLDPLHGAMDLRAKIIRECSATAMRDDPIRVLRAVRLAALLNFRIEESTRASMRRAAELLPNSTVERQRDELFKMLGGPRPDACLRALAMLGVLPHFLPELQVLQGTQQSPPHVHNAWEHTLSVLDQLARILDFLVEGRTDSIHGMHASQLSLGLGRYRSQFADQFATPLTPDRSRRSVLEFAALYHDAGKPSTRAVDQDGRIHFLGHESESANLARQRAEEFNLSNSEIEWIESVARHHMRFFFLANARETQGELPSRRAVYRFFRDAGESAVDLILLGLADVRGTRGHTLTDEAWSAWIEVARTLAENLWDRPQDSVRPPRIVDGHALMDELGITPGPDVGQILDAIREAQATGMIHTREEAMDLARDWVQEQRRDSQTNGEP